MRQRVELLAVRREFDGDLRLTLLQRLAHHTRGEEIGRFDERRRGRAHRHIDDPVFDRAVLGDQNHQGPVGPEADKLDVFEAHVGFRRDDKAGAVAQARQHPRCFFQCFLGAAPLRGTLGLDRRSLVRGQPADLEQTVDKEPQTGFGRQASRRHMRRIQQPGILQVGHDIADRCRRQFHAQPT